MDRRAIFTPAFTAFLATQQRLAYEQQIRRRYRQPDGTFKYSAEEWQEVKEPSYRQDVIPQTLTDEDLQRGRWPIAIYRITLENGKIIETFAQSSREFLSNDITIDFMGLREVLKNGETREMDEFSWTDGEMNDYSLGNLRGTVLEPLPL